MHVPHTSLYPPLILQVKAYVFRDTYVVKGIFANIESIEVKSSSKLASCLNA